MPTSYNEADLYRLLMVRSRDELLTFRDQVQVNRRLREKQADESAV